MRCGDCKFYHPNKGDETSGSTEFPVGFGTCERWDSGYGRITIKSNEVHVEDDEGWGAQMGPDFGCVLFEVP